jgi:hypothetical protein
MCLCHSCIWKFFCFFQPLYLTTLFQSSLIFQLIYSHFHLSERMLISINITTFTVCLTVVFRIWFNSAISLLRSSSSAHNAFPLECHWLLVERFVYQLGYHIPITRKRAFPMYVTEQRAHLEKGGGGACRESQFYYVRLLHISLLEVL